MSLWCRDGSAVRSIIGIAAMGSLQLPASPTLAQSRIHIEVDASVFVAENPFLLSGDHTAAGAVGIAARPSLRVPLDHSTDFEIDGEARLRRYHRRYGEIVTGRAEVRLRHRADEHLSLLASTGYTRALPTDAITEDLGAALDARSLRTSVFARTSIDWHPSQYTLVQSTGNIERTRYPAASSLLSTKAYNVSLGVSRQLNLRTSVGAQAGWFRSSASGDALTAKTLQLTGSHRLNSTLQVNARAGVEWSSTQLALAGATTTRPRFSGSASLCQERSRFTACATASLRSEFNSLTGLQRELAGGLNGRWRLTERGTLLASADYRKARGAALRGQFQVLEASASYEHRLARRFRLAAGLDYLRRQRSDAGSIASAIFHVTLTFERGQR